MFEGNLLTFNPRWDSDAKQLPDYTDVGDIQARLKDLGVTLAEAADPATTAPASVSLVDPDASVILIDQHV